MERASAKPFPVEIKDLADLLGRKPSGVVHVVSHLEASKILQRLAVSIDRARPHLTASHARRLQALPYRWHAKNLKRFSTVRYSDDTVQGVANILFSTTVVYWSQLSGKSVDRKGRDFKRLLDFVKSSVDTLIAVCEAADFLSWRHSIVYLRRVCKAVGISLDTILSSDVLGRNYTRIEEGIVAAIERAIDKGETQEAELLFGALPGHDLRDKLSSTLSKLMAERGARFPIQVQQSVMNMLGKSRETTTVEYVNPADSPQLRQLSVFLLHLWDRVRQDAGMRQSLEQFKSICEKEFKLFLRGEVGTTTNYDQRVHETGEKVTGEVRLLRPWVEFFDPPAAFVVIRGLVEPADE